MSGAPEIAPPNVGVVIDRNDREFNVEKIKSIVIDPPVANLTLEWESSIRDDTIVSIFSDEEYVYCFSEFSSLQKINISDGTKVWGANTGFYTSSNNGYFAVTPTGHIYSFIDRGNGAVMFRFDKNGEPESGFSVNINDEPYSIAIDSENYIYVGTKTGIISKYSFGGSIVWTRSGLGSVFSIAFDSDENLVICNGQNSVTRLWSNDGLTRSSVLSASGSNSTVVVGSDDSIYRISLNKTLLQIKTDNTLGWTYTLSANASSISIDEFDCVYVLCTNGLLYKFDSFGNLSWSCSFTSTHSIINVGTKKRVYMGGSNRRVTKYIEEYDIVYEMDLNWR
nr:hypothetical protein [Clostridioides sp.]